MKNRICRKLAFKTLLADKKMVLPFLLGTIIVSSLIVCMAAVANGVDFSQVRGGTMLGSMLTAGQWIIYLMALCLMFYMNSFFTKSRRQDNGMLSAFGLEKKHLILVLFWQFLMVWLINLVFGTLLGILFQRLLTLFICSMMSVPVLPYTVIWEPIAMAEGMITAIFVLVFVFSSISLLKTKPMELLRQKTAAQKPLKNRWFYTLAGIISTGIGYYISLTTTQSIDFINNFLIAVLFVIAGTYCLFMAGFSTLLNALSKNKKFYYSSRRFISVTNMKYRFRQNSAALATICIFSTMILVALATTCTLWFGGQQTVEHSYRENAMLVVTGDNLDLNQTEEKMNQAIDQSGIQGITDQSFLAVKKLSGKLVQDTLEPVNDQMSYNNDRIFLYPLSYYNQSMKTDYVLNGDEALIIDYGNKSKNFGYSEFKAGNSRLNIIQRVSAMEYDPLLYLNNPSLALVVNDDQLRDGLNTEQTVVMSFNLPEDLDSTESMNLIQEKLYNSYSEDEYDGISMLWRTRELENDNMLSTAGSALLVGLYISIMILVTMILVLYYKQVTEGEEDKKRFLILSRLGLNKKQLKQVVENQAATMFFLPLILAMIHIIFAYPSILTLFKDSIVYNAGWMMMTCFIAVFAIYALIYLIIYRLTAQAYLSAVKSDINQ